MIDLATAERMVTRISEVGTEIAGETFPIDVRGVHGIIHIQMEHRIWDNADDSDWMLENDIEEVETEEQLRAALFGELERFSRFLQDVLTVARLKAMKGDL